jgi:hypothetical protein
MHINLTYPTQGGRSLTGKVYRNKTGLVPWSNNTHAVIELIRKHEKKKRKKDNDMLAIKLVYNDKNSHTPSGIRYKSLIRLRRKPNCI